MNLKLVTIVHILTAGLSYGQGVLVFDQQSTNIVEGSTPWSPSSQPMGQSFTPPFSAVNFVELRLFYSDAFNHAGATVQLNIRAASLTGPILGSTATVFIPYRFLGATNFFFANPLTLSAGTTYYMQPVILSGGNVSSFVTDGSYAGGTAFYQGASLPDFDLWFREGVVVPEPSSLSILACAAVLVFVRRKPSHL